MSKAPPTSPGSWWSTLRPFLPFLRPYRASLAGVLLLVTLSSTAGLAYPLLGRALIDNVLLAHRTDLLIPSAAGLVALGVVGLALSGGTRLLYLWTAARLLTDMRAALLDRVLHMPARTFSRMRRGELAARLHQDLVEAQRMLTDNLLQLFSTTLGMVVSAALMLWLDVRLALLALALTPLLLGAALLFRGVVARRARQVRDVSANLLSFLVESLERAWLIQTYAQEDAEVERYRAQSEGLQRHLIGFQLASLGASTAPALVLTVAGAVVFLVGGRQVAEGSLSLGSLLALAAYQLRLFGPLRDLVSLVLQMARASASLARVAELWEMPGPRLARPQVTTVPSRLRAEGLEFGYDRPLLSGIDLEIEAGQMVVLVGPNGCGKSTLVKLMFGLETPSSGRFLIDDEVADPARARACMAWVPHEPFLLHASLRENLLWACPGAEQVRLDEALEVVGLSHWLAGLDDGWETTVGERGLALSDGQRQRLSLARAWLRGCGTLVLDEALSCLDPEAQDQILRRIKGQRTCLVLEHREQAMAFADVVYAMDAGGRLRPRQPV